MWYRLIVLALVGVAAVSAGLGRAHAGQPDPADPVTVLLADPDYPARRAEVLDALQGRDESPCVSLRRYFAYPDATVREHAVRAMADSDCDDISSYLPFLNDQSAWVIDSVVRSLERHLVAAGVPFLIDRLADRRRILSEEGSWAVGDAAHRALRVVSCRSFHYDPAASREVRDAAFSAWRAWFIANRDESREVWIASGLEQARNYVGSGGHELRLEGLELLMLLGDSGLPDLRAAFGRAAEDLSARVVCEPDEPPRVTEQIPCALIVENASMRRLTLAPAEVEIKLARLEPGQNSKQGRSGSRRGRAGDSGPDDVTERALLDPAGLARRLVELEPGQIIRRKIRVGPVASAGRYEIQVTLPELGTVLARRAGPRVSGISGPITASTVLKFGQ